MDYMTLMPGSILWTERETTAPGEHAVTVSLFAADDHARIADPTPLWSTQATVAVPAQAAALHAEWLAAWQQPGVDPEHPPEAPVPIRQAFSAGSPDFLEIQSFDERGYLGLTTITAQESAFELMPGTADWRIGSDAQLIWSHVGPPDMGGVKHGLWMDTLNDLRLPVLADRRAPVVRSALEEQAAAFERPTGPEPTTDPRVRTTAVPEADVRVLTVAPAAGQLGQFRLLDLHKPDTLYRYNFPEGTEGTLVADRHQDVVETLRSVAAEHPEGTRALWTALAARVATGESIEEFTAPPPRLHPQADQFRIGAADMHLYVIWKEREGHPPDVMRAQNHQAQWPAFFPSADAARDFLSDFHGYQVPDPPEIDVPPEVQRMVNRTLGAVRNSLHPGKQMARVPEASAGPAQFYYGQVPPTPQHQPTFILWREDAVTRTVTLETAGHQGHPAVLEWQSPMNLEAYARKAGYPPPIRTTPTKSALTAYRSQSDHRWVADATTVAPNVVLTPEVAATAPDAAMKTPEPAVGIPRLAF